MRMRRKPWARPELAACEFFVDAPQEKRGQWHAWFPRRQPLHIELGCGKGTFMAQLAAENPQINYLAVDIKSEVLAVAKRNIEKVFAAHSRCVDNVALTAQDIERIFLILDSSDPVQRIYINFCNPWPREKHKKRRLTHTRQLEKYKVFLAPEGEIHFKTDDSALFEDTLFYLRESGFAVCYCTYDLHNSDYPYNIVTEHENMFAEQGIPIKFLIAKQVPADILGEDKLTTDRVLL